MAVGKRVQRTTGPPRKETYLADFKRKNTASREGRRCRLMLEKRYLRENSKGARERTLLSFLERNYGWLREFISYFPKRYVPVRRGRLVLISQTGWNAIGIKEKAAGDAFVWRERKAPPSGRNRVGICQKRGKCRQ